jgi:hypothetical protein
MKKTIAILLVLVIGMVGVFADPDPDPGPDARLDLSLEVKPITQIYVSNVSSVAPKTYEEFNELVVEATVKTTTISLTDDEQPVGTLHYMTNAAVGTTVLMSATLLTGSKNIGTGAAPEFNTIGYSVKVGSGENIPTVNASAGAITSEEIPLTGETGKLTISSHAINVTLVKTDYLNAAADDYIASIYFNFITT